MQMSFAENNAVALGVEAGTVVIEWGSMEAGVFVNRDNASNTKLGISGNFSNQCGA